MALSSTTSVSKGCFLFNAQAKPSTRVLQGQLSQLPGETNRNIRQRNRVFECCWSELKEKIEQVVSEQHREVVSELLRFIGDAQKQLQNLHTRAITYRQKEKRKTSSFFPSKFEIPAAALIAGVNMPDHSQLFSELRDKLHSSVSPHVVLLRSNDCSSGMKELMSGIRRQLLLQAEIADQSSSDDEEGDKTKKVKRVSLRGLPLCSVSVLSSWYQEQHPAGEEPRVPVVLVIEDFESFPPTILQDLITSLSPHLPDFPVVLVLGLATTVNTVHRLLPQGVSSLLALEQIHAQPATKTFTTIIKEIFLTSSVSFKLGPNCFKFLLRHFFYTDFSITNVTRHIQFSVMEHFFWQPLSFLCHQEDDRKDMLDHLTHKQCEMIRSLLSYRRYVESLEPKEQLSLLEDDKALKENIFELLGDLDTYHQVYYPLLECFHCFVCELPEAPFGKSLHELYSIALECYPTGHAKFPSAWMYLRVLGKDDLSKNLEQCIEILRKVVDNCESAPAVLATAASTLSELYTELEQLGQKPAEHSAAENESTTTNSDETTLQQRLRFQERLRKLASQSKALSGYESLRARILEQLMDLFKKHLEPPSFLPLHEIFYFDQHKSLRKHLAAAPRVAIQTALNQPNHYLTSAEVVSTDDSIPSKMPDLCIAYQLHTECGTMINLYDWMQSYSSIASPPKPEKKQPSGKRKSIYDEADTDSSEEVIQARFIQSVSEMQFLGFIKPTHRKTDHVQRLTWGAC